jgi:hypothetical protein
VQLTRRQAERIATHDWTIVCALAKDILVTGDVTNPRYSKWAYAIWHEMPFEVRRRVLMAQLDGGNPDAALDLVSGVFYQWYIEAGMGECALEVYCLDVSRL